MTSPESYRRLADRWYRRARGLEGRARREALIAAHELRDKALEAERIERQTMEHLHRNGHVRLDIDANGVV